ncbi:kinesin-like protein KIN-5C [Tanacetum coccineum]
MSITVDARLESIKETATGSMKVLDGHVSFFNRITLDAKRKWQDYSSQAENDVKESAHFVAAKDSRFDLLPHKRHSKKTHNSVIEMERKHVTAKDSLLREMIEFERMAAKSHEMIIKKKSKIVKAKGERRSLALKDKKESSDDECSTFRSEDDEYAMATREPLFEDILGATTQRDTRSSYLKRYWELLPKEILGAITQIDTRMSYGKMEVHLASYNIWIAL